MPPRRTRLAPGTAPLKRTPLRATPGGLRRSRLRPVNPARRASEFARCFGSTARVLFVQALPCVVCGARPSENAHVGGQAEGAGMGRRADAAAVAPLCPKHHREHHHGPRSFEARNGIDLLTAAAATERAWQASR